MLYLLINAYHNLIFLKRIVSIVLLLVALHSQNLASFTAANLHAQGIMVDTTGISSYSGMVDPKPYFFDGLKAFQLNDLDAALEFFSMAHTLLPEQAGINFALAKTYLRMGDLTSAAYHAKEAARIQPTNKWYWLKLSQIYRSSAQFDDALNSLEKASKIDPNDSQILQNMLTLLASVNRFEEAIDIVKRIGEQQGYTQETLLQLYALQEETGEIDGAIETLKKLIENDPNDPELANALNQLLLNTGRYEEVAARFKQKLAAKPKDIGTALLLMETLYKAEKNSEALDTFNTQWKAYKSNKAERNRIAQFVMALSNEVPSEEINKSVETVIEWLKESEMESPQALATVIDYYTKRGQSAATIPLLKKLTELLPFNEMAWRQYLQLLYTQSRFGEVVVEGMKADKQIPDDPYITFFVGSSFQLEGQSVKAVEWLVRSSNIPADKSFRSVVFGSLGDTYAGSDIWEDAYRAYDRALRFDPSNDNVLNNYAYYLSESGGDLAKAEEMSRKSIEFQPDQASYLDTLGWIIYLKGDYKEALKWIKKAIDTGNASATIIEHYGDVFEALKDKKKAQKWWAKALEMDPSRTYLIEKIE